ncbi:hypothetical protein ASA1KI_21410 [Opitutales bacterium ASA1]|uniref:DUF6036 family nucleotidyltransferase n=1 Tax=Congregicoccus parvus TaxID=3081749 RepID=UPI002B30F42B|nr:hypothetical protein ASA1KI_21410 [Opitutales bacterium ASA1]
MPDPIDISRLDEALGLLAERLRLAGAEPQEIVVCGGSSLIARGYVSRVTRDVDVVARRVRGQPGFVSAKDLPAILVKEAARVAADLRLPADWFNSAAHGIFDLGFPEGFEGRLESKRYGSHLEVWFIGRLDQIHFKLHAAVDRDGGRHLTDLLALKPNAEELLQAARWTRIHDPSEGFRFNLSELLKQLSHGDVAKQL